jgi:hypothetical protein
MNGQLWQQCERTNCHTEPVCVDCFLFEDHCTCTTSQKALPTLEDRQAMANEVLLSWGFVANQKLSANMFVRISAEGIAYIEENYYKDGVFSHTIKTPMVHLFDSHLVPGFQDWRLAKSESREATQEEMNIFISILKKVESLPMAGGNNARVLRGYLERGESPYAAGGFDYYSLYQKVSEYLMGTKSPQLLPELYAIFGVSTTIRKDHDFFLIELASNSAPVAGLY